MASVAVAIGVSLIGSFITSLLTPKPKVENNLDDLSVLKSEYGVPIPFIRGRQKVTGNVIWAPNIRFEESSQGGGKGGGGGGATVLEYFADFAVLLCEGEIDSIGKIWFNNRLVYNGVSTDPETIQASAEFLSEHLTIYTGTLTQNPDPLIESIEGVGNVPGFRGKVYLVFRDVPLERYGNAVPKVDVEVLQKPDPDKVTLREVIEDLLVKPGITSSQYDVTDTYLDVEMDGFYFNQGGSATREAIEDLQKVFQFVVIDNGAQLIFREINAPATVPVYKYALATILDNNNAVPRATEVRAQEEDLPSEVQIEYDNSGNNYNRGLQTQYKATALHTNELNFKSRVAMDDSTAQTAISRLLDYYWVQSRQFDGIRLNSDYIDLNPGDVIQTEIRGQQVQIEIEKLTKSPDLIVEISGFSYDEVISTVDYPSGLDGQYNVDTINVIPAFGNPTTIALDTNLTTDAHGDIGLYATAVPSANSTWVFGTLFGAQSGGSFNAISGLGLTAAQGELTTVVPSGEPFVVDTETVFQVVLDYGTLESVPNDTFYGLSQMLYINGELIAFQNASLVAANTYDISNLIRGARGTEASISAHAITDPVYLIRGNTPQFDNAETTAPSINQNIDLKSVPNGAAETLITNITNLTPFQNLRSYPYAGTDFVITKNASNNDLILNWTRRTRKGGIWNNASDTVPISEDFLLFDIEIYNGMTLVRTIFDNPSTSYTYTSADQVTDFGSNQNALNVTIYQKSSLTGRGYAYVTGLTNFSSVI